MDSLHAPAHTEGQQKCEAGGLTTTPTPALRLLTMAEKDLEASKILYERERYPQATFLFQQTIEKAAKVFGILYADLSEKELKSGKTVGHNSVRVYEHTTRKFADSIKEQREAAAREYEKAAEVDLELTEIMKELNGDLNRLEDCARSMADKTQMTSHNSITIYRDLSVEQLNDFIQRNEQYENFVIENRKLALTPLSDGEMVKRWDFNGALSSLYLLSLITQPHAIASRYPEGDFDPLEFYTPDRPLIQALPSLYRIADRTIDRLHRLYATISLEVTDELA